MPSDDQAQPSSFVEQYGLQGEGGPDTTSQPDQASGQDTSAGAQSGQGTTGSGSPSAKDKADKDGLPAFDPKKTYLVRGDTLNRFATLIKRNKPKAVTGGGVRVAQESQDGTFFAIDADELKLAVCISGVSTTKTFYVKKTSGS